MTKATKKSSATTQGAAKRLTTSNAAKQSTPRAARKLTKEEQQAVWLKEAERLGELVLEKRHDIPIHVMFLEIDSLIENANPVRDILAVLPNVGVEALDTLPYALEQLRKTQRVYEQAQAKGSTKAAARVVKEAAKLEKKLVEAARLIYAHDPVMLARINLIIDGDGVADQADDLRVLNELLEPHAALLERFPTLPAKALEVAKSYAEHLEASVNRVAVHQAMTARNQAFWVLNSLAETVRLGLRFIYANQPKMLKKVLSQYNAQRLARQRKAAQTKSAKAAAKAGE